ncbi:MAG: ATP-binding protein [Oscillospiraceae bacterium]
MRASSVRWWPASLPNMDPTLNQLSYIKTAVYVSATNSTLHAYPDSIGRVVVKVRQCAGNLLEITVRDYGRGIGDIERAIQPMYTTGGEGLSGMGFTIMKSSHGQRSGTLSLSAGGRRWS